MGSFVNSAHIYESVNINLSELANKQITETTYFLLLSLRLLAFLLLPTLLLLHILLVLLAGGYEQLLQPRFLVLGEVLVRFPARPLLFLVLF